jgi:metal-responsive CopG/Arc/MetJ family transcriptional regulator
MATAQTRATEKYRAKLGIVKRTFNLPKALLDEFEQACKRAGISRTKALEQLIAQFNAEHPE